MVEKTALVTGITGQTGSYLAELLLEKGYRVHGLVRRHSSISTDRIDHILDRLHLHYGDVTDAAGVIRLVLETNPDEIYNLAAMSHVRVSFDSPAYAVSSIVDGTLSVLEAARMLVKPVRVYTACSSEVFGSTPPPQCESTVFHPRSPYACAKCVTGTTKIYTTEGPKTARTISIGDKVWTHTGQFREVTAVYSRETGDPMVTVVASASSGHPPRGVQSNLQVSVTTEHPVLTARGWVSAGSLRLDDSVAVVASRCKQCNAKIPLNRSFCGRSCRTTWNWCDSSYRESAVSVLRERFTQTNHLAAPAVVRKRQNAFARHLRRCGMNYMEHYVDLLIQAAAPGFFEFVGDGKLEVEGLFPDWIHREKKAIIEFFGYGEGLLFRERQLAKKCRRFEAAGYKVLVIRGTDFRKPSVIREQVAAFCASLGSVEYTFVPVRAIRPLPTKVRTVYNFEVADDHSYVGNGVVLHNCYAFHQTRNYREAYGMFCSNGILFNHESPRRGETFVTRKITMAANRIKAGLQDVLYLGNLDARRDWGFAGDYVDGMWRMLQQETADDFVLATGETHSVREFLDEAFGYLNLDWKDYVRIDERYFRPAEVDVLCGDASKARRVLGWEPKVTFKGLVRMMVDGDAV